MRLFSGLVAIVLTVLLAACGGGGGPPGVLGADGQRLPLSTTAPSSVVIATAVAEQYNIIGGRPPYQVISSDTQVAIASVVSSNRLSIGGRTAGNATITLSDVDGQKVSVAVTITAPGTQALFSTAPASVTMAAGRPQSYNVGGGSGFYTATSSNTSVAIPSINAGVLTITGLSSGDASIVVRDSVGATVIVAVTVQAPAASALFTTAPASITIAPGLPSTYGVGGGTGVYTVASNNTIVASASLFANTLTITGLSSGSADIVVRDNAGTTSTVAVTVQGPSTTALFTSAPASVTLAIGAPPTYSVGGGTAPYTAASSNIGVASVGMFGSSLIITGLATGDASIVVRDSLGASVTVAVTVQAPNSVALFTTAPASVTVPVGAPPSYIVGGGTGPYFATSNDTSVVSVFISGTTLIVNATGAGNAIIVVRDSVGATVNVAVTVPAVAASALSTTAPSSITIASAAVPAAYTISGGTPPYVAASSNAAVAFASVSVNSLVVSGRTVGNASVEVSDAAGGRVTILVTVTSSSGAALSVLPAGASGNVGDTLTFTLHGGSPGYTLGVSNASIATLSTASIATNPGTFNVTLLNVGETSIRVQDAQGQTTSIPVTVGSVATLLRVSPSSFVVGENELSVITLNIFGGTPPYRALSSDLLKATALTSGNTLLNAVGTSATRCINPVTDSTPPEYIVSGTYDVTLTVIDSLGASATSIMTIKDNGAGLNLGCP